jgi:tetratricopeptide (TPR) repeat protein
MKGRAVLAGLVALLLAISGVAAWKWLGGVDVQGEALEAPLPVPPLPPRIAEGAEYERCLAMLPADPQGARATAEAWVAAAGGEAAEHCLALAFIALGEPEEAAARLQRLAGGSKAPGAARAALFDQAGQAWLMAGDPTAAFAAASEAVALAPETPDLLVNRAVAAEALARWSVAEADLTQALAAEPRRADALVLRGAARRHLDRLAAAQDDIERALALDGRNAEALLERGILRQRRNDPAGARADWERTIALAPDSQTADLAQQNLALLEAGPEER